MAPKMTPLFSLNTFQTLQTTENALKRSIDDCIDTITFDIAPSGIKRVHSCPEKNSTIVDLFHHPYVVASTIALICHVEDTKIALDSIVRMCYENTRDYLGALSPSRISGEVARTVLRLLYTPSNTVVPIILQAAIGDLFIPFAFEPSGSLDVPESHEKSVGLLLHDTLLKPEKNAFVIPWFNPQHEVVVDVQSWPFVMRRSNTMKSPYIGYWSCDADASVSFLLLYHPNADDVSIVEAGDTHSGIVYARIPRMRLQYVLPTFFPTAYALEI